MSLTLHNSPFFELFDGFNRQFSRGNDLFDSMLKSSDFHIVPPVDLVEKEDSFVLHASVPGAAPSNITVDFHRSSNELKIAGTIPETKLEKKDDGNRKYYREINTGLFERTIRFGKDTVDEAGISAKYNNGVLEVLVPKVKPVVAEPKIKRIQVGGVEKKSTEESA
ncbi:hypothetical protein DASC09_005780 [Saccharomycopsis crataegensis]|uniref:SHSP domain-containing protein n=1 Tax=Saccharomycopsis crataegensis TaxID=43959 RepID=A0AAV5QGE7_9ASCO|nr:hypothetical protein DASC09_005780 [Saccharomycopsis crataegensis]